jgi:uncharacterized protein UPF0547
MGRSARVRAASLVAVIAATVAGVSIPLLPWYRHPAYADALDAWTWVPESGLVLGVATVVGGIGLAGLVAGERLPRLVAILGALASIGLSGLVVYRLFQYPSFGLAAERQGETTLEAGLAIAAAAAACSTVAALTVAYAVVLGRTCPDCAERIGARAEECPHCGHRFPLPKGWRRCNECGGKIRAEARVCKHCRATLGAVSS